MSFFLGAAALAVIHLFASKLRFLDVIPRSRWLSISGGVAVAYVMIHLLPELHGYEDTLRHAVSAYTMLSFTTVHVVWLLALFGLVFFYGLEKVATSAKEQKSGDDVNPAGTRVFWLHMASYSFYNALIGYLLVTEGRSTESLVLFIVGIGLHFVVNDHGLRHHHQVLYRRYGRWILAAAVMIGWAVGAALEISEVITAAGTAFLGGGILLSTFKEELPKERESRFSAFATGAFAYAMILIAA